MPIKWTVKDLFIRVITERDQARHERNEARRENDRLTLAVKALEAQIAVLQAANRSFGREGDEYE